MFSIPPLFSETECGGEETLHLQLLRAHAVYVEHEWADIQNSRYQPPPSHPKPNTPHLIHSIAFISPSQSTASLSALWLIVIKPVTIITTIFCLRSINMPDIFMQTCQQLCTLLFGLAFCLAYIGPHGNTEDKWCLPLFNDNGWAFRTKLKACSSYFLFLFDGGDHSRVAANISQAAKQHKSSLQWLITAIGLNKKNLIHNYILLKLLVVIAACFAHLSDFLQYLGGPTSGSRLWFGNLCSPAFI